MKIVECIPNFSEARRPEVVEAIINAVSESGGVHILDQHSDLDHNRTVLTFVGQPEAVEKAAFAGIAKAAELIDLDVHKGEHPRMGATDVVPFVPISEATMDECVEMARRLGKKVGEELDIPVYFYEEAALRKDRVNLEDIRRGEYEGLKQSIGEDPYRKPDFGPQKLGKAGATVIGARQPLIAYNVYLNSSDVKIAQKIGRRVRNSNGGFRYVKGMGVLVNGMAQVSMNLTNYKRSPMAQITEFIRREAQRYGVGIQHSELVGLIPNQALIDAALYYLQLDGFEPDQLLDNRVYAEASKEAPSQPASSFVDEVAAGTPAPGGGSVAAHSGALAVALVLMVARLTVGRKKYAAVEAECSKMIIDGEALRKRLEEAVELDAQAFDGILQARRMPKDTPNEQAARQDAIHKATLHAAAVPLETARDCLAAVRLAFRMAEIGNTSTITDAASGVHLGIAACKAALLNVKINLAGVEMVEPAVSYIEECNKIEAELVDLQTRLDDVLLERAGL